MTATRIRPAAAAAYAAIPGPAGHPLLGMAGALRGDLLGTLQAGFAAHGDVVAYRVGPRRLQRRVVAFHHPDDVRRVFTDTEAFTRDTRSYRALRELVGSNLVTAGGDDWRWQKQLLQPLFTHAAVREYAPLIEQEAHAAAAHLAAAPERTIDGLRTSERYALRVLGRTLFRDEHDIDEDTIAALAQLVPLAGRQLRARATQPLPLPLRWPTPRNRRFSATRDALDATVERVLAQRAVDPDPGDRVGLLARLRDARDPGSGQRLSDQGVRDQALVFMLAGFSTTAAAICATLHLLGRHPALQERIAAGGEQLARAAVQEALRLHPPSYVLGRRVGAGGAEIAGHALTPGTDVLVAPWITQRHPRFWSDPEAFDPWRFVDAERHVSHAWLPFGGGARVCIGRQLALLEAAIIVRALLERCRLESLERHMSMDQLSSMRPSRPVWIRCRPR